MITFDWQLTPPKHSKDSDSKSGELNSGEDRFFPRLNHSRHISTEELLRLASAHTVFDRATLGAALGHLVDALVDQLQQGNSVTLGELGTFSLQIAADKPVLRSELHDTDHVSVKGIRYVPSPDILSMVGQPPLVWSPSNPIGVNASSLSGEQIYSTLKTWFDSHEYIKCKDISSLFNVKPTSANALVNSLLRDGILVRSGKGKNTVYYLKDRISKG